MCPLTKTTLFLYSTPKQKRVPLIFVWMKKEKFRFRALLIRNLLRTPEVVFKGVLKREKTKEEVIPRVQLFNTVRFRTNRTSPVSCFTGGSLNCPKKHVKDVFAREGICSKILKCPKIEHIHNEWFIFGSFPV